MEQLLKSQKNGLVEIFLCKLKLFIEKDGSLLEPFFFKYNKNLTHTPIEINDKIKHYI